MPHSNDNHLAFKEAVTNDITTSAKTHRQLAKVVFQIPGTTFLREFTRRLGRFDERIDSPNRRLGTMRFYELMQPLQVIQCFWQPSNTHHSS